MTNQELCAKYSAETGRELIVYATTIRDGMPGKIAASVIPEFISQIEKIPKKEKKVDILVESNGGDPIVVWRLVNILRNRFEEFGVLVPYNAYSAATLLAMGANSVYIGNYGCLGPIDPQIEIRENGQIKHFAYEDIMSYLEFTKEVVGLTEQEFIGKAYDHLLKKVEPAHIGFAKRSSSLALTFGTKLLMTHIDNEQEAKLIAEKLNKSFYNHSHSLDRKEIREMGLNVLEFDESVEDIIWEIHKNITKELDNEKKLDFRAEYIEENPELLGDLLTNKISSFDISTVNPQMQFQILKESFQDSIIVVQPIQKEYRAALLHSERRNVYSKVKLAITLRKTLDFNIIPTIIEIESKWE